MYLFEVRRLESEKIITKVVNSIFGKNISDPKLYVKLLHLEKDLVDELEKETLKWEAQIRGDYEKNPRFRKRNEDGTRRTDVQGRLCD